MNKIVILASFFSFSACAQMRQVCFLPNQLEENSGIIHTKNNELWLQNDGGNSPCIHKIDSSGSILRSVCISNAPNKDWEDLAIDRENGFLYIGDFGNNDNLRRDLRILKIQDPDSHDQDSVAAEIIEFYYPEQQAFPPAAKELNFDAEAFIYFNNYLYIFTKCRTKPYTSLTKLYQVPCIAGKHAAVLLDSFDTRQASWYQSVTGAAISPKGEKLALISGAKIWIFSQFTDNQFFKGKVQGVSMLITQKEAIDFAAENELYFSDERSFLGRARLYHLQLKKEWTEETNPAFFRKVNIAPMPIRNDFELSFKLLQAAKVQIHLYDEDRNFLATISESDLQAGEQSFSFNADTLELERYFSYYLVLEAGGKQEWHPIVVR